MVDRFSTIDLPGMDALKVSLAKPDKITHGVSVWEWSGSALDEGDEASQWLTNFFGKPCRLVRFDSASETRPVDPNYAPGHIAKFSDMYPFLLISQGSLDSLNKLLREPVPIHRFIPIVFVDGCEPFAEDLWTEILIDNFTFHDVKLCSRCKVPTINQETGIGGGQEPIETLRNFRSDKFLQPKRKPQGKGVLVFLAAKSGFIKGEEKAAHFQNFIICVEMLIAAACHFYDFPYKEYAGANVGGSGSFSRSLSHAVKLNDFYHDTVHQFAPTYHDYVLYNHNDGVDDEGTKKYRSRTFLPTGQEMDAMRKSKPVYANKIDGVSVSSSLSSGTSSPKSSSVTSDPARSDAVKSSLLVDASDSLDTMYDMSLIDINLSSFPSNVPSASESRTR